MSKRKQPQRTDGPAASGPRTSPSGPVADPQSLYGNAHLQEALLCPGTGDAQASGSEVEPSGATDPRLASFLAETFAVEDFVPSTGGGCFDAAYDPQTGMLDIGLRLGVTFALPYDAGWAERGQAWWNEGDGWTSDEKAEWLANLEASVEAAWATDEAIECVRPGWCVTARPVLDLEVTEGTGGHYDVTVHKSAERGSDFRPGVSEGWGVGGTARMEEDHTDIGIDSQAVRDAAFDQVEGFTDPPLQFEVHDGEVQYALGQQARVQAAAAVLDAMPPGSPRISQIWVHGWDGDDPASIAAEEMVVRDLPDGPHGFYSVEFGESDPYQVTFRPNRHPDGVQYDDQFQYAAHEVGHMLGLPDEYEGHGHAHDDADHEALIEVAGASHVMRDMDTSSIMSRGGDVLSAHLVTLWEALGHMTAEYLEPDEWQF